LTSPHSNVLFLLVDCLREDRIEGKGSSEIPAISSLRKSGVTFTDMTSVGSVTTPCVASILTGLYPPAHGIRTHTGKKLSKMASPLSQVLKENGYHTYAEVTGPLYSETGLDRGFDEYNYRQRDVYFSEEWGESLIKRFETGDFREPWFVLLHLWELHQIWEGKRYLRKNFDTKRFGATHYDRSLSSLDDKLWKLLESIDLDHTLVVLLGDHGEKIIDSFYKRALLTMKQYFLGIRRRLADISLEGLVPETPLEHINLTGHGRYQPSEELLNVPLIISKSDIS